MAEAGYKLYAQDLCCFLSGRQVLHDVTLGIPGRGVTAVIGPSGSGKSTFLRCLNRLNDLLDGARITGRVLLDGADIYAPATDTAALRRRVGLVLQASPVFPGSIMDNLLWAPRLHGAGGGDAALHAKLTQCLGQAALWADVASRLDTPAANLSIGQQQRLCIARALMLEPEVLLMDEPVAALDPHAAAQIGELIGELALSYTLVVVTHDLRFARRLDGMAAVFHSGRCVESGPAAAVFGDPGTAEARAYLAGGGEAAG